MNTKNILGQKIYQMRTKKGLSQAELGRRIGVSHVMISLYEKGAKSPQIETLKRLADVLEVDFNYFFLNNTDEPNFIIRLYNDPVCAENGTFVEDHNVEMLLLDGNKYNKFDNLFAIRVVGDSMVNAHILEDDIVICRVQEEFKNNDIVVAAKNYELATLKRYKLINGVRFLYPENSKYEPIIIDENTKLLGKVIEVRRKYE